MNKKMNSVGKISQLYRKNKVLLHRNFKTKII